jgi:hypothetical protein
MSKGYRGPLPRSKARLDRGSDHSHPSSAEFVNELELYFLSPPAPPCVVWLRHLCHELRQNGKLFLNYIRKRNKSFDKLTAILKDQLTGTNIDKTAYTGTSCGEMFRHTEEMLKQTRNGKYVFNK